jgi:Tol biopolymer transport system component
VRHALAGVGVVVLAFASLGATGARSPLEPAGVVWATTRQLVFTSSAGGIYVISATGGRPRLLTRGTGDVPSVRRDGTLLYGKSGNLLTIPLTGGKPHNLGSGFSGVWSPDGTRIAYMSNGGDMVENAQGHHKRLVVRNRYGESTGPPTWSPDGRKLAYVACRAAFLSFGCEHQTAFDVYVIGVDGSGKQRLTSKPGFPQCPAWSRAAKLAFFAGDDVVAVVKKGGGMRTLRPGDCPVWAPNGRRLAVATATGAFLMNFDGGERKRITVAPRSAGASLGISWSPDGKWLAVVDGSDHPHLWVVRTNGTGLRRIA